MPQGRICLDCNRLYIPPADGTRTNGRCPTCHPTYLANKPRGRHADTPQRRLLSSFYKSRAWKRTREAILQRDAKCSTCGTYADLQVHHIQSIREAPELALDPGNLLTLCQRCHARESNATRRRRGRAA